MNISFPDVQINRPPPPLPHQSGDGLKVSELEEQIVNEYHAARNAHFKMANVSTTGQNAILHRGVK